MPIRAVVFDLDNTLIFEDESTSSAIRRACELAHDRTGVDAGRLAAVAAEQAESLWRAGPVRARGERFGVWWGEALWGDFGGDGDIAMAIRAFAPAFRLAVWSGALAAVGVHDDALARDLAAAYVGARRSAEAIDPEAEPLLALLARDRRLALLTNGASDVQREKLSRTRFGRHFSVIVISLEVGVGKPEPRVFEIALERLGVRADEAVMVGDSLLRDVAGAQSAGLHTVWIDRGLWDERGPVPDATIRRLSDLPAALDDLERRRASLRATP